VNIDFELDSISEDLGTDLRLDYITSNNQRNVRTNYYPRIIQQ